MAQFPGYFWQCSKCEWQDCIHTSVARETVGALVGFRFACLLPVINPFMRRQMQTALFPPSPPSHAPWDPAAAVAVRAQIINLTNCPSDWPNKPSQVHKRNKLNLRFALPKSVRLSPNLASFNLLKWQNLDRKLSKRGVVSVKARRKPEMDWSSSSNGLTWELMESAIDDSLTPELIEGMQLVSC